MPAIYLPSASDPFAELTDALLARREGVVDKGHHRIRTEVPVYGAITDQAFIDDVREHIDLHHEGFLRSLRHHHPLGREDLGFIRPRATRRVGRIPLAAFMHTFRIFQEELWDAVLLSSEGEQGRATALEAVSLLIRFMNLAATEAAEVYLEAERLLHARGERVRRDLLEDLLAGRPPAPGPKLTAARDAGLLTTLPCILVAAQPLTPAPDEMILRSAAVALSRATGSAMHPLTVVRQEELIVIASLTRTVEALVDSLETVREDLCREGIPLAIGVSTLQADLSRMSDAYQEAVSALQRARPGGGVVALPTLSAFDCLALFGSDTARRVISPRIHQFVLDDAAADRVLSSTLLEYVASDFNVKVTAEHLFLHPNTVRYRLSKIEEQTGSDLRRVADVLDLMIALRI